MKRRNLLIAISCIALMAVVAWVVAGLSQPSDDKKIIEILVQSAAAAFNDKDWEELAQMSWPQDDDQGQLDRLKRYKVPGAKVKIPVTIKRVSVSGEKGTAVVRVEYAALLGQVRGQEEYEIPFVKHDENWYFDWNGIKERWP